MTITIKAMSGDEEIAQCFTVMSQLRPHLSLADFVQQVKLQMHNGYHLAATLDGDTVVVGRRLPHLPTHWPGVNFCT